jgi:hypothetical protein
MTVDDLELNKFERNCTLLERLRENEFSEELLSACVSDAELGRMTSPRQLEMDELGEYVFSPRFGVHQGARKPCNGYCTTPHVFLQVLKVMGASRFVR